MIQLNYTRHSNQVLRITADETARAELRELEAESDNFDSDATMADVFEHLICNSEMDWIDPSETGDLTSAPMIGVKDEDGRVWERWAFMDYCLRSPLRDLLDTGYCDFVGGSV